MHIEMESSQQLAKRLREVILNGTWIANTNYKSELQKIDWQLAIYKGISNNSIAELSQHIHYYIKGVKHVFEGGRLEIKDKYSFDFKEITSQDQWNSFLKRFWKDTESLSLLIEKLSNEHLNQNFTDKKYGSYQRNIEALIEHSYYHLGQIVLIRKSFCKN